MVREHRIRLFFLSVVLATGITQTSQAQTSQSAKPIPPKASQSRIGLDLFGGAGVSWPGAQDSFEAVDLRANPIDFGGGARVTGLWGGTFLQLSGNHWSDTGNRVFIDADGNIFHLGIPLDVNATFVEGTIGVKRALGKGRSPYLGYLGAGAGVVRYSETSPFAESGEDLKVSKPSYHVSAGLEVPILRRLAAVMEGKYRYVPDLLGRGGASAVLAEESFGGFSVGVGLRIGLGGRSAVVPQPPPGVPGKSAVTSSPSTNPASVEVARDPRSEGVLLEAAPVYLLPDAARTPVTQLETGTWVKVLEEKGDWLRIEFRDSRFGARFGWVEQRFVRFAR